MNEDENVNEAKNKALSLYKYNRYNYLSKINSNEENRFKLKKNVTFLSFLLGTGYLEKLGLKEITSSIFSNVSNVDSRSYDYVSEAVYFQEH